MAFNHVLFDILVENSIDGIEDLGLADAPAAIIDQIFKDSALAPRQWQRNSLELRIPAVEKDPQFANHGAVALALVPAPVCSHLASISRTWIGLRTTSSTPAANKSSVCSRQGVSFMAITGARVRSLIILG
jgi:hypothetical protein